MSGLPAAFQRLLIAYTMVFRVEFRVSVASLRAISQIAVLAILQTIALPTELPRREPHFTRKSKSRTTSRESDRVGNHVHLGAQRSRPLSMTADSTIALNGVAELPDHCPSETSGRELFKTSGTMELALRAAWGPTLDASCAISARASK